MKKCFINNSGFSIIGTLTIVLVSGIILVGTRKTIHLFSQSSEVTRNTLTENELRKSVGSLLENTSTCKENLKPSRIAVEINTLEFYLGNVSSLMAGPISLIDTNVPFKGDIDIVKLAISGSGNPSIEEVKRNVVVYYKKKRMGKLNTVGNEECSSTNTNGCYFLHCTVAYKLQNIPSDPVETCTLLNCSGYDLNEAAGRRCSPNEYLVGYDQDGAMVCVRSQADQKCEPADPLADPGQYLFGFDMQGDKVCRDSQSNQQCSSGFYLVGFDSSGRKLCKMSQARQSCGMGNYLVGFNSSGRKICRSIPQIQVCPQDEYLAGFDSNGDKICRRAVADQQCSHGNYLRGYDSSGNVLCSPVP